VSSHDRPFESFKSPRGNTDILLGEIRAALAEMRDDFTTHELILRLAQQSQHAYIEALQEHLGSKRPFQTVHSKIAKCLRSHPELATFLPGSEADEDIFGQRSENAKWRKAQ
jgi:hypothetical protein